MHSLQDPQHGSGDGLGEFLSPALPAEQFLEGASPAPTAYGSAAGTQPTDTTRRKDHRRVRFSADTHFGPGESQAAPLAATSNGSSPSKAPHKQCYREPALILHNPKTSARHFAKQCAAEEADAFQRAEDRRFAQAKAAREAYMEKHQSEAALREERKAAATARIAAKLAAKQAGGKKKRGKKKR